MAQCNTPKKHCRQYFEINHSFSFQKDIEHKAKYDFAFPFPHRALKKKKILENSFPVQEYTLYNMYIFHSYPFPSAEKWWERATQKNCHPISVSHSAHTNPILENIITVLQLITFGQRMRTELHH